MRKRVASLLAIGLWIGFVVLVTLALLLFGLANKLSPQAIATELSFFGFATIGALISSRRPENVIGWLFCAIGIGTAFTSIDAAYQEYALAVVQHQTLAGSLLDWAGNCTWNVNLGLGAFVLLLFPTGHLPSRRWRLIAWLLAAAIAGQVVSVAFLPGRFSGETTTNPVGIESIAWLLQPINIVSNLLFVVLAFASVISVIVRFIKAGGNERQQLKWFAYGACILVVSIAVSIIFLDEANGNYGFAFGFAMLPIGAGIGVLRYRLYDIDVIINRTLVYGSLTLTLALIYLAAVLGTQHVLPQEMKGSQAAIVGSTLLVASLFQPLRHRIQTTIDLRFYRSKYDAAKTLDTFTKTLRQQVDLSDLSGHLLSVVEETMQPAHASLWLSTLRQDIAPDTPASTQERVEQLNAPRLL
ncbi:MAG: hypothetical protein ACXVCX_06295 [Ktedonobacterales bacterium]